MSTQTTELRKQAQLVERWNRQYGKLPVKINIKVGKHSIVAQTNGYAEMCRGKAMIWIVFPDATPTRPELIEDLKLLPKEQQPKKAA